jgi:iron complex transport system ATP-binding protein
MKNGLTREIINSDVLREIYDMDIPIQEQNGCRICVYFNSHT